MTSECIYIGMQGVGNSVQAMHSMDISPDQAGDYETTKDYETVSLIIMDHLQKSV